MPSHESLSLGLKQTYGQTALQVAEKLPTKSLHRGPVNRETVAQFPDEPASKRSCNI